MRDIGLDEGLRRIAQMAVLPHTSKASRSFDTFIECAADVFDLRTKPAQEQYTCNDQTAPNDKRGQPGTDQRDERQNDTDSKSDERQVQYAESRRSKTTTAFLTRLAVKPARLFWKASSASA